MRHLTSAFGHGLGLLQKGPSAWPVTPFRRYTSPTLLIVGGRGPVITELNRAAVDTLAGEKRLEIVPGAWHLFEELGAVEYVAGRARDWFTRS